MMSCCRVKVSSPRADNALALKVNAANNAKHSLFMTVVLCRCGRNGRRRESEFGSTMRQVCRQDTQTSDRHVLVYSFTRRGQKFGSPKISGPVSAFWWRAAGLLAEQVRSNVRQGRKLPSI